MKLEVNFLLLEPISYLTRQWSVPPGILSVLPGYGPTVGKEVVSHPAIRKVDITVGVQLFLQISPSKEFRLGHPLDVL